jgi:uncharacterized protein
MSKPVMYQEWRSLLFLHWEVSPEQVQARLPDGLAVDTFEGKTYLGLVPFTMRNVRPVWSPAVPWLSHFHETNVRVYVKDASGRAGVYFFSLEAANLIAVKLARKLFHLPYYWASMSMQPKDGLILYQSSRSGVPTRSKRPDHYTAYGSFRCAVTYGPKPGTELTVASLDSLEHFLIERYHLFSHDGKRLYSGQVAHAPYQFQPAVYENLYQSLTPVELVNGRAQDCPPPLLAHYSPGVQVDVFALEPVP